MSLEKIFWKSVGICGIVLFGVGAYLVSINYHHHKKKRIYADCFYSVEKEEHRIEYGDTFWKICKKREYAWKDICTKGLEEINGVDPTRLRIGQKIYVPIEEKVQQCYEEKMKKK